MRPRDRSKDAVKAPNMMPSNDIMSATFRQAAMGNRESQIEEKQVKRGKGERTFDEMVREGVAEVLIRPLSRGG